ncbi:MAG: hypothetical protein RL641_882 [Candidatus Parcubacteria bacterium]|jgi:hypothetical protein
MKSNDLITYIENEIKRGVAHDTIQDALVAVGWKPLDIADAFRSVAEKTHGLSASVSENTPAIPTVTTASPVASVPIEEKPTTNLNIPNITSPTTISQKENTSLDIKVTEGIEQKPKGSKLLLVVVLFGVALLAFLGYFFIRPLVNDPAKKVRAVVETMEKAKSIQYSGEYEISAPAGLVLPDKALVSTFGGLSERQAGAKVTGSFFGVDDWFDYRSKKNEVKFATKISISETINMDFTATSRLIGNAFYARLSESATVFDQALANQGANWVRFDKDMTIPPYAYGFWGGTNLYDRGFPRDLALFISQATVTDSVAQQNGDTVMSVNFTGAIVDYFSSILFTGDKLGESTNLGPKYDVSSLTELPIGKITFGQGGIIKKAVIVFSYKTKEYTLPVQVKFSLSFDRFDTPPTINIPSLVIPYEDLEKKDAVSDAPEVLKGFFSDVRMIASVYKGVNNDSFRGVCIKKGEESEESTELTIPFISTKIISSGYELPVCSDTETAWSYYTHSSNGYYCTDSRGYSGKVARQPLGDKCN